MSYQALYRVWRPQCFADLVGQKLVAQTLKNAISTQQISHAYLFCGPRGTGKTSAAKIFAKAINCKHQVDGEPCNQCEICQAITQGSLNDVIEFDAASNNGVDEIREIRDKVKYAPTQADYKVYIIDEVHMLSSGAFNALLKTLEEPPANVVFILATTEPHKVLPTIISRTQRFDFKRILPQDILERMQYILEQKQVKYQLTALKLIAKAAQGGMRDALSILDQVISFGEDDEVTFENALLVTGSVTQQSLQEYLQQIFANETSAALMTVHQILEQGKDPQRFIEELIEYCRDLLLYCQAPQVVEEDQLGLINEDFKQMAQNIAPEIFYRIIETLNTSQESMRFSAHAAIYLEVLTVKLTQVASATQVIEKKEVIQDLSEVNELKQQVAKLKQQVAQLLANNRQATPRKLANAIELEPKIEQDKIDQILVNAKRDSLIELQQKWNDILMQLPTQLRAKISASYPVACGLLGALITIKIDALCQAAQEDSQLCDKIKELLGWHDEVICFISESQWPKIRQDYVTRFKAGKISKQVQSIKQLKPVATKEEVVEPKEPKLTAKPEPLVDEAIKLFGEELIEVTQD